MPTWTPLHGYIDMHGDPQIIVATTGATLSLTPTLYRSSYVMNASGALLALTINLADGIAPGQELFFTANQTVTTLTMGAANILSTLLALPTTLVTAQRLGYIWHDSNRKWLRVQ